MILYFQVHAVASVNPEKLGGAIEMAERFNLRIQTIEDPITADSVKRLISFWDPVGDMGEFLSGIVVKTKSDYLRAANALGIAEADALKKLSSWSVFHLPDSQGYPVQVSYETYFDPDDSGATDAGGSRTTLDTSAGLTA